jgi:alpha-tubulin suppressor-like RCC1 family protein
MNLLSNTTKRPRARRLLPCAVTTALIACGARSDLGDVDSNDASGDALQDAAVSDHNTPNDALVDAPVFDDASPDAFSDVAEVDVSVPDDAAIPDAGGPLATIAGLGAHGCATNVGGIVKCWGAPWLGDGTSNGSTKAVVVPLPAPAIKVVIGDTVNCARLQDDTAWCWGSTFTGMLGPPWVKTTATSPIQIVGLGNQVLDISVGTSHACAVVSSGGVKCWGRNDQGELGNGTTFDSLKPVDVLGLAGKVIGLSVNGGSSCALLASGSIQCWGQNSSGQLGTGDEGDLHSAGQTVSSITNAIAISAGGVYACALLATGAVKCWGDDGVGELGDNVVWLDASADTVSPVPVNVLTLSSGVSMIASAALESCALLTTGAVKCWGRNHLGGLGDGTTVTRHAPVDVLGLQNGVVAISETVAGGCALLSNGGAKCWGSMGDYGADGGGATPVAVVGLP